MNTMKNQNSRWMDSLGFVVVFLALVGLAASARADGTSFPLPADGSWVRYRVTGDGADGPFTRTETIRFVGTVRKENPPRRWFEQEFGGFSDGRRNFLKIQLSEDEWNSPWPLAERREYWHKEADQPVKRAETLGPEYGLFGLMFPGPYKSTMPLKEPRTIEYQRGQLEIREGLSGRHKITVRADDDDFEYEMHYRVWRRPDVPQGPVAANFTFRAKQNGREEPVEKVHFVLDDFGNDAKSDLPDHNSLFVSPGSHTTLLTRPPRPSSDREYTLARSAGRHHPKAHGRSLSILSPAETHHENPMSLACPDS